MDTGQGNFIMAEKEEEFEAFKEKYPEHGGMFTKGQILHINGSRFKIISLGKRFMKLELRPKGGE